MNDPFFKLKSWISTHAIACSISVIAALIIAGLVLIIAVDRLDHTPQWWSQANSINPNDPGVIEQGESLENAISTQLTAMRDLSNPQWSVAITPEQANSWLATRLIETISTHFGDDHWPAQIERVRIGIHNDRLSIGMRVVHDSGSLILWANATIELDEHGDLWARVSSTHVGMTPMPLWIAGFFADKPLAGSIKQSRIKLGGSSLDLGDGRRAQLIALRLRSDRLELVIETRLAQ